MYKTTITLEVLSEEPIPNYWDLEAILYDCNEGGFVLGDVGRKSDKITDDQMKKELIAAGSEPSFFGFDE